WRGAALLKLGRPEALRDLKRAVELDERDGESHIWLAEALIAAGETAQAARAIDRARVLAPQSAWPFVLEALADPSRAKERIERARETWPQLIEAAEAEVGSRKDPLKLARAALKLTAGNRTLRPTRLFGSGGSQRLIPLW